MRPHLAQLQPERLTRPGEPRFDGADGDAERIRDFFVAEPVDLTQHDRRALVERQAVERLLQPFGELLLRENAIGGRFVIDRISPCIATCSSSDT